MDLAVGDQFFDLAGFDAREGSGDDLGRGSACSHLDHSILFLYSSTQRLVDIDPFELTVPVGEALSLTQLVIGGFKPALLDLISDHPQEVLAPGNTFFIFDSFR